MKLLFVEDETLNWRSSKKVCDRLGISEVEFTVDSIGAVKLVESFKPDVIMLDMNLEDGDKKGLDVLSYVKENDLKIEVFVLSGNSELKKQSLDLGAKDFFEKPFGPIKLQEFLKDQVLSNH